MFRYLVAALVLVFAVGKACSAELPDLVKTPGAVLTEVLNQKMAQCLSEKMNAQVSVGAPITLAMVCTRGYTQCVRNVPNSVKEEVYKSYGLVDKHSAPCNTQQGCEVDHLISLELGGSNDQNNLWPEPYEGTQWNAHVKDKLENWLHAEVCAGRVSLKQAQEEISSNWIEAYKKRLQ